MTDVMVPLAMLLIFGGLAFRLTAVPFHFYSPDVYQGTSHANAGLLSTLPKIAGLAALARILLTALPGWEPLGWKAVLVVSVLTMTVGNILALWQNNIRRLLAYSSIAHAGYLLIGVAVALAFRTVAAPVATTTYPATSTTAAAKSAASDATAKEGAATATDVTVAGVDGLGAAMFYLAVYIFATLGAFAALVYLSHSQRQIDTLDDIAGLNRTHPMVALVVALFMFSLAGVPPLAGFWGKFSLIYTRAHHPSGRGERLELKAVVYWAVGSSGSERSHCRGVLSPRHRRDVLSATEGGCRPRGVARGRAGICVGHLYGRGRGNRFFAGQIPRWCRAGGAINRRVG